jgi:hypothetical protein
VRVLQLTFNSPMACTLSRQKRATGFRPTSELGKAGVQFWADTTADMKQLLDLMHEENPELPRFAFGHSFDRRSHKRTSRTGAVWPATRCDWQTTDQVEIERFLRDPLNGKPFAIV